MIQADTHKQLSAAQWKQLDQAFHKGVPTELRKTVWSLVVPNTLKITPKLYKMLLERVSLCQDNVEKDQAFKKNTKVIDEDLHRTYADLKVFRFGNKLY